MQDCTVDPAEWEEQLRQELNATLASPYNSKLRPGLKVNEIRLVGSYPDTEVVFLFRDKRRPECRFGFCWGTFWDWVEGEEYSRKHGAETPRSLETIIWTNFDEARDLHLPKQCLSTTITWIE